ncbi:hypothetical protein VPH35_133189 [Triticum aestivum]
MSIVAGSSHPGRKAALRFAPDLAMISPAGRRPRGSPMTSSWRSSRASPPRSCAAASASVSTGSASSTTPTTAKVSPKPWPASSTAAAPPASGFLNRPSTSPPSQGTAVLHLIPPSLSCPTTARRASICWTPATASSSAAATTFPMGLSHSVMSCAIPPPRSGLCCPTPARPLARWPPHVWASTRPYRRIPMCLSWYMSTIIVRTLIFPEWQCIRLKLESGFIRRRDGSEKLPGSLIGTPRQVYFLMAFCFFVPLTSSYSSM